MTEIQVLDKKKELKRRFWEILGTISPEKVDFKLKIDRTSEIEPISVEMKIPRHFEDEILEMVEKVENRVLFSE